MALLNYEFHDLKDLFIHELKDLYDAEYQLTEALPLMAQAATTPELRHAFQEHFQQTQQHVTRLEQVFRAINCDPERDTCPAMKGIVKEGSDIIKSKGDATVRDAALIAAAQRAEHYEIASYGSMRTYAMHLGRQDLAQILQQTLDEEGQTDKKLTKLAEQGINQMANA